MKTANVYYDATLAGRLVEDENGFTFQYESAYLSTPNAMPVSLTLPLQSAAYHSQVLFPFFDGLIPEGWLLEIAQENWKIDVRDRMALLLACCKDCIGNISIVKENG